MFTIRLNERALKDMVDPRWRREIPFVLARTMTRTLQAGRVDQQKAMEKHIEGGPTRFTKSSIRYRPRAVNKLDLYGELYYHGDAPYMGTIIDGGIVRAKKKKLSEPVYVRLNKHGNIPAGAGGNNKYTSRAKKNPKFFLGIPKGPKRQSERFRGVWQRYGKPKWNKRKKKMTGGKIRLMVSWARGQRMQDKSFPAVEVARKKTPIRIRRFLPIIFRQEVMKSMSRRGPTGF